MKRNAYPCRLLTTDNIFISDDGEIYLGCFGNESDNRFQSPEEHRGEETLYNADVNSIGVILYTLFNDNRIPLLSRTLSQPTRQDIAAAVQRRHSGAPLPPPLRCGNVLTGILLKACAYKPKARYANVEEFKAVLENLRSGRIPSQEPQNAGEITREKNAILPQTKKTIATILTVVVVLVVSGFIIGLYNSAHPIATTPSQSAAPEPTTETITIIISEPTQYTQTDTTTAPTAAAESTLPSNEAVNNEYPDSFFAQIAAYHSGNYYLKGLLEQDGDIKPTQIAISKSGSIYMTSDVDNAVVGILRDKEKNIYLVHPAGKSYLELSPTVLRILGMDTSALDGVSSIAVDAAGFVYPNEINKVMFREQELVCCTYFFDSGKIEMFYLDTNGAVKYIESYSLGSTLENTMVVEILTADIPPEMISPPADYTEYSGLKGMISFVTGLTSEE